MAILIIIKASPTRFLKAVINPALLAFVLWKYTTRRKEVTPKPSHPIIIDTRFGLKIRRSIEAINLITNR